MFRATPCAPPRGRRQALEVLDLRGCLLVGGVPSWASLRLFVFAQQDLHSSQALCRSPYLEVHSCFTD